MTASRTVASTAPDLLDDDREPSDGCEHVHHAGHSVAGHSVAGHSVAGHSVAGHSWLHRRLTASILFYQRVREGKPSPCRFFPTCSAYALEAVEVHGTRRGSWLSLRRLLRCRPLGPSGFDPVPEPRSIETPEPTGPTPSPPVQKGGEHV